DESGNLVQAGTFEKGIRIGVWNYFSSPRDSIFWERLENRDNKLVTNIPNFLEVNEKNDSLLLCKYIDTSKIFNLLISNGRINEITALEAYKTQFFQDLDNINFIVIDTSNQFIETNTGRKYFYSMINGFY